MGVSLFSVVTKTFLRFMLAIMVGGTTLSAYALEQLDQIDTAKGVVSITRKTGYVVDIKLGNHTILTTEDYEGAHIAAIHGRASKPDLLLLVFYSGNECAGFYRVLDLSATTTHISEEFGTCGALADPKDWDNEFKENPRFEDGGWYFGLANASHDLTWFFYKNGKVIEEGKGVVKHKNNDWRFEAKLLMSQSKEMLSRAGLCVLKEPSSQKRPQDELVDDMMKWTDMKGGYSNTDRKKVTWKKVDLNKDGQDDWVILSSGCGLLGCFGSVYLSAPKGGDCSQDSWCYAGSGFEDDVMEAKGPLKCESEYRNLGGDE